MDFSQTCQSGRCKRTGYIYSDIDFISQYTLTSGGLGNKMKFTKTQIIFPFLSDITVWAKF